MHPELRHGPDPDKNRCWDTFSPKQTIESMLEICWISRTNLMDGFLNDMFGWVCFSQKNGSPEDWPQSPHNYENTSLVLYIVDHVFY